jgi:hypothetical protein
MADPDASRDPDPGRLKAALRNLYSSPAANTQTNEAEPNPPTSPKLTSAFAPPDVVKAVALRRLAEEKRLQQRRTPGAGQAGLPSKARAPNEARDTGADPYTEPAPSAAASPSGRIPGGARVPSGATSGTTAEAAGGPDAGPARPGGTPGGTAQARECGGLGLEGAGDERQTGGGAPAREPQVPKPEKLKARLASTGGERCVLLLRPRATRPYPRHEFCSDSLIGGVALSNKGTWKTVSWGLLRSGGGGCKPKLKLP